jgi:hypothetical protein
MRSLIVASFVALFSLSCGGELSAPEEAAAPQVTAQALRCDLAGAWCITTCSRLGPTEWQVVAFNPPYGTCQDKADAFCRERNLGVRDKACWGKL